MTALHKTLDQRRAADAWTAVDALRSESNRKDITRAAKKLPIRILTAGLGHALLFIRVKDKAPALLDRLSEWVLEKRPAVKTSEKPDLMERIRNGSGDDLRRHTAEVLAWLVWFNRFAEAEFPKDFQDNAQGDTDGGQ